jgi:protein-disulfide isomerase
MRVWDAFFISSKRGPPEMFVRKIAWAICLATALLLPQVPVFAAGESEDLSNLRRDIEALKAGQQKIAQDLAEVKRLLQSGKMPPQRRQPVQDINLMMDVAGEPFQGEVNAPLTLVEMTDFECPFCSRHAIKVIPEIIRNYVSTGKLRYVVRDFPLQFHKKAKKAAEAAHCAGNQGKYWEMHKLLFANAKALGIEQLTGYAAQLALDTDAFTACLESEEFAEKILASQAEGSKAGVTGTPTTFLGWTQTDGKVKITKRITGAQPYQIFQQAIEGMLSSRDVNTPPKKAQPQSAQPTAVFR